MGASSHTVDHHGTRRIFDIERYEMSKFLAEAVKAKIEGNALTHISRSYGGNDNLIFVEMADGRTWVLVYCLQPQDDRRSVRMEILSSHSKPIDQKRIARKQLSYFARMCIFKQCRIPNA